MTFRKLKLEDIEKLKSNIPNDRYVSNPFYILFLGFSDGKKEESKND